MSDYGTKDNPLRDMLSRARDLNLHIEVGAGKRVTRANAMPADDFDGWEHDRYRVKLTCRDWGRRNPKLRDVYPSMTTTFRKGAGHNGSPPTLEEVLDSLVSDAHAWKDAEDFADFADTFGYVMDGAKGIRKAQATYDACKKAYDDLIRLVGEDALDKLFYETERL